MKNKKVLAVILILIILLSAGCQNKKIEIADMSGDSIPEFDENGKIIPQKGLICFAVYGKDGDIIVRETLVYSDYKKDISVAEFSKDICRELNIPIVFAGMGSLIYVQGISNLFEFDDGPESGWIYAVNGEFQGVGCGSYVLKDRDYVEWCYTLDLGKDLGAYRLTE